jgi:hypothetical protein
MLEDKKSEIINLEPVEYDSKIDWGPLDEWDEEMFNG